MKNNKQAIVLGGLLLVLCVSIFAVNAAARPIGEYPLTYSESETEYGHSTFVNTWVKARLTVTQYSASTFDYSYISSRGGLPGGAAWFGGISQSLTNTADGKKLTVTATAFISLLGSTQYCDFKITIEFNENTKAFTVTSTHFIWIDYFDPEF
ncbi:MAG: hypothetical protein ACXAEF_05180 [Candidatus Thorarchaeota archaeon]|jgi:hypothetical protein